MESLVAVPTYSGAAGPSAMVEPLYGVRGRPMTDDRVFRGPGGELGVSTGRGALRSLKRFLGLSRF